MNPLHPPAGRKALCAAMVLTAMTAAAHPGHGLAAHGPLHVATSPYHLAMLALGGAALWLGARRITHRGGRRLVRGLGVVLACGAGVLGGLGV